VPNRARKTPRRAASRLSTGAFALFLCLPAVASETGPRTPSAEDLLRAEHLETEILSLDGDAAFGEYLGGECVTCHQSSSAGGTIPPIAGLPVDHTVRALVEYKLGLRANEVMRLMTARLEADEIAALAAYFAELSP
jgi:cytochrome c